MGDRRHLCTVDDCDRIVNGHGLCPRHYWRMQKYGSVDLPDRGTATEQFWASVEKTDTCWNWTGPLNQDGYGRFGKRHHAHRFAYELANGPIPAGSQLDHACLNRRCVRPVHLRPVTAKQNGENRSGPMRRSTSGVRGVSWKKARQRWQANVRHNGVLHFVGEFRAIADAEAAVIAKRLELFTHNELDKQAI